MMDALTKCAIRACKEKLVTLGTITRTKPAWMPEEQEHLDIRPGDMVRIHLPDGYVADGVVISANNYSMRRDTDFPQWYIETKKLFEKLPWQTQFHAVVDVHGNPGCYGYWKQGSDNRQIDGGWVEEIFAEQLGK